MAIDRKDVLTWEKAILAKPDEAVRLVASDWFRDRGMDDLADRLQGVTTAKAAVACIRQAFSPFHPLKHAGAASLREWCLSLTPVGVLRMAEREHPDELRADTPVVCVDMPRESSGFPAVFVFRDDPTSLVRLSPVDWTVTIPTPDPVRFWRVGGAVTFSGPGTDWPRVRMSFYVGRVPGWADSPRYVVWPPLRADVRATDGDGADVFDELPVEVWGDLFDKRTVRDAMSRVTTGMAVPAHLHGEVRP